MGMVLSMCGGQRVTEDGQMPASQCVAKQATDKKSALELREHFFSFSGNDHTIRNDQGSQAYVIKGNTLTIRDAMVIWNSAGTKKICLLQRKLFDLRTSWQIFTFHPNTPNQKSTESSSGEPCFRFAKIERDLIALVGKRGYSYRLYSGNDEGEIIWRGEIPSSVFSGGDILGRFRLIITNTSGQILANVNEPSSLIRNKNSNCYTIDLAKGVDALGVVCFAAAIDEMREEDEA
jgi:uncharacterized protein YxjI|tara:strand:- start:87 stop:788 length:702 start_codon:yes stop_codon:yes gene_type:complete